MITTLVPIMELFDRTELQTSGRKYTAEGFLVVDARIARTGIQEYLAIEMGLEDRDPMTYIKVYRPSEEVFSQDSMSSFANKVVTDDHPTELVNAKNATSLTVGYSSSDIRRDGIFLVTQLHIIDDEAIQKIKDGKVELSNGYTSDIDWTPGITPDGIPYDAIQRNIKGNHIALVDRGRCGSACKVSDNSPTNQSTVETTMPSTVQIDGVDFEVTDQVAQAVKKLQRRLSDAEEENTKLEEKVDELEEEKEKTDEEMEETKDAKAKLDTLQAKLDDALAKVPTPKTLDQLVENRLKTRDAALRVVPGIEWEGKDCETLRKEVITTLCADVDVSKVSADYIRARFDALASTSNSTNDVDAALSTQHRVPTKTTDSTNVVSDARNRFAEESRNAWKKGGKA